MKPIGLDDSLISFVFCAALAVLACLLIVSWQGGEPRREAGAAAPTPALLVAAAPASQAVLIAAAR